MRRVGWLLVWACLGGCKDIAVEGGQCQEDSDCAAESLCLYDQDREATYCTQRCAVDTNCPSHQVCRAAASGVSTEKVCVDKLRSCGEQELCNGLDDNCDGVVDEAGCAPLSGCLDDCSCGNFVCQPTENQPKNLCVPPNESAAPNSNYKLCSVGAECINGVCETGLCSPLCAPSEFTFCPVQELPTGAPQPSACMRAVGDASRPRYNACQLLCNGTRDCRAGQECVWRTPVDSPIEEDHAWVCSALDPGRKPLGSACTNNEPDEGDDECQHGLCYKQICTRICGGPATSCTDVNSAAVCKTVDLRYGPREFATFVCDPRPI